jgi:glucokinase
MKQYCFGIDVGGTTIKCGFFNSEGDLLDKWEIPTRKEDNGSHVLPDIAQTVKEKIEERGLAKDQIEGIGIDIPGFWKNIGRISAVPAIMIAAGYMLVNWVIPMESMLPFLAGVCIYSIVFWLLSWIISMNAYERDLFGGLMLKMVLKIRKR